MRIVDTLAVFAKDRAVREAFFVFAITRALILAIFILGGSVALDPKDPGMHPVDTRDRVVLHSAEFLKQLQRTVGGGDAGWYEGIAKSGYERQPFEATQQHTWAFFPLHPMLMRLGAVFTGEYLLTGALIANALFFTALVLLHKLVTALNYDAGTADRTVFYVAAGPVSYFFSVPMTESLYFCLTIGSFLAATHRRWWVAGILGGFSSAARVPGVLLLPALTLFHIERTQRPWWRREILWLGLIPVGLLSFSLFLWRITGNPLAFRDAAAAWNRGDTFFLVPLYDYLRAARFVIEPWNFRTLNFLAAVLALAVAFFWAFRRQWAFATLTFLSVYLPLSTGILLSGARIVAVIFPVYLALAIVAHNPRLDQAIRTVSLVFLGFMAYAYAMRFTFAST